MQRIIGKRRERGGSHFLKLRKKIGRGRRGGLQQEKQHGGKTEQSSERCGGKKALLFTNGHKKSPFCRFGGERHIGLIFARKIQEGFLIEILKKNEKKYKVLFIVDGRENNAFRHARAL